MIPQEELERGVWFWDVWNTETKSCKSTKDGQTDRPIDRQIDR